MAWRSGDLYKVIHFSRTIFIFIVAQCLLYSIAFSVKKVVSTIPVAVFKWKMRTRKRANRRAKCFVFASGLLQRKWSLG